MKKAKDVQVYPLTSDTLVFRSRTWDRLKFEIEYGFKRGTTANSYLIQRQQIALINVPGESFSDTFLASLIKRIDPEKINYLILGHVNPNRCVTIKKLLELAPKITLVCSNPAAISLGNILENTELNIMVIKGEETLDLGGDRLLEFVTTPNPRYPDHLCTYDQKTGILYTDKLFSAHVCGDQIFDEGWSIYQEDRRYYFDCVLASYATQVENSLQKLAEKNAQIYATGHGPLVKYGLQELNNNYQELIAKQKGKTLSVALIYASAYGNTGTLAGAIARGILKAGIAVESLNAEIAEPAEIKNAVEKCAGFIMGSPTLGGHTPTQIQTALGIVLGNATKDKLAGVFGSFGWSGEAIDLLENKFKDAGYSFGFEPIRVKFSPTEAILKMCEEAGTDFAQAIKKAVKNKQAKTSVTTTQSDRTTQALGRLVGSLCVVTTSQDEVKGAMLASWVSQATFNPPGFTVAVAKERAIESLMYSGSQFVLNILQQGNHIPLMKQFLKPFAPGEERFQGIDIEIADNGCPILKDALAYLECRVDKRMECGDHWVIYAIAQTGNLLKNEGVTAIHHRKSGHHY
jgi:flavorubredoxin/flavin reductase (DIM6/NTAB) family NADH-FMN oxidoreductase RutF